MLVNTGGKCKMTKSIRKLFYICNMNDKPKPIFEKHIFGDVNFENIDYDAKWKWAIAQVFERGDVQDIRNYRRYYGDEKVAEALTNAKYLPLATIYLACAVLDNKSMDYRCYRESLSNPQHWIY